MLEMQYIIEFTFRSSLGKILALGRSRLIRLRNIEQSDIASS